MSIKDEIANDLEIDAEDAWLEGDTQAAKTMSSAADSIRMNKELTRAQLRYAEPYIQMKLRRSGL